MEIRSILALDGANVFSSKPIIKVFLDLGKWTGVYTDQLEEFTDCLVKQIPSLTEHYCSRGKPGGFVERLKEGTLLGHVVEHVSIELMNLAGHKVIYGKTLSTDEPGVFEIVMEYEVKEGAMQAAKSAVELVSGLLEGQQLSVQEQVNEIRRISSESRLGPSTAAIIEGCRKRDIPAIPLGKGSLFQLGYGKYQKRIEASITGNTSCIGVDIAGDKTLTKELLAGMGIAVPAGGLAQSEAQALAVAAEIDTPVAIKPHNGNQGKGVALDLRTEAQIKAAFMAAIQYSSQVIVEKFIPGKQYRLLVVGGKFIAAAERVPAHVIGDGVKSIRELVNTENLDPQRGDGHELSLTKIHIDSVAILALAKKGYVPESIPPKGEVVYLRENANLSTGGIAKDVTEQTHPSQREIAEIAAKIVGLDVAGIDVVTPDISREFNSNTSAIIEVNAAPGLRMHEHPSVGACSQVGEAIVNHLFPLGTPFRVPVVSVSGTNGKTTTTRLISHILSQRSLTVGMANSDGIWIGHKRIIEGDTTGPSSARVVLCHPDVEAAVLETARGGILRAGLGYDYADVAVITNISEDHFGQFGIENLEDLAHVKSVVAEAVRRHSYVVLNADDPYTARMAAHTKGRVIFFSMLGESPLIKQYLGTGGTGVFIKRGKIVVASGQQAKRIGNIKSFPITLEGKALHNVQNLLAAVGAAWALGIPAEEIRQALNTFYSSPWHNPGRLNIYNVNGFKVMIDYGHNAAGIEQIISFARKLNPRRLIGVITVPGDRPDESISKVGLLAGKGFDYLFIREDEDLRDRSQGEVAGILRHGALEAGMRVNRIQVILSPTEAFRAALEFAVEGDLVIYFYEKLDPVLNCLDKYLREHKIDMETHKQLKEMAL